MNTTHPPAAEVAVAIALDGDQLTRLAKFVEGTRVMLAKQRVFDVTFNPRLKHELPALRDDLAADAELVANELAKLLKLIGLPVPGEPVAAAPVPTAAADVKGGGVQ